MKARLVCDVPHIAGSPSPGLRGTPGRILTIVCNSLVVNCLMMSCHAKGRHGTRRRGQSYAGASFRLDSAKDSPQEGAITASARRQEWISSGVYWLVRRGPQKPFAPHGFQYRDNPSSSTVQTCGRCRASGQSRGERKRGGG